MTIREIVYYTDGSCWPNPGPGGYAVIRGLWPRVVGFDPQTTNIRMEGIAIIEAMKDANGEHCLILTDSEFWINVITRWAPRWARHNWTKNIKNPDLVKEAYACYQESQATLVWIKGHANNPGNELADHWATVARGQQLTEAPARPKLVRKKVP